MTPAQTPNYRNIVVSGKIAVGTSTLARNLHKSLGWEYVNAGEIQRQYDRDHNRKEYEHGSTVRPDEHEREIEAMTKQLLTEKDNIIYEAWLGGFIAKDMNDVLKVLVTCSNEAVRIDRVAFRDSLTIDQAKKFIKQREQENVSKWKTLYGDYDFWDPKYFDLVIDTYATGPMETMGKVLDKLAK